MRSTEARLAQSVERKALNLVVVGSSPTVGGFRMSPGREKGERERTRCLPRIDPLALQLWRRLRARLAQSSGERLRARLAKSSGDTSEPA